jgi:exonuclease VII small subunit
MTEESEKNGESAHAGSHQAACGPDTEQAALAEIEQARNKIEKGEDEIKHGLHDIDKGNEELKEAEAHLEEAHHRVVHFEVDGEEFETREPKQMPNFIIKEYGHRDPATHYLVEIDGGKKISFQGKGNEVIEIHDCARFQTISVGPTPVSDGTKRTGTEAFFAGLTALGHKPEVVKDKPDHLYFAYEVQTGEFAGKKVQLGFVVPLDFPLSAPTGPHVSPHIHPINSGGLHPTGCIQDSPPFNGVGSDRWQYWSRPHQQWGSTKKTVAAYMSHIWKLWDSQ